MTDGLDRQMIEGAIAQANDTRHVVWGRHALDDVADLFAQVFGQNQAIIVADETTFAVAGRKVVDRLRAAGQSVAEPFIFPATPTLHADLRHVVELESVLRNGNATPIAVGSGTINDLTKLTSYHCQRPYLVVATAASMDGYAAWGAAITDNGVKQTFPCAAPRAILADLDVLAAAPPAMSASGYADLAGKITAGADWLLADALAIEPIKPDIWQMVQGHLRAALSAPDRLALGDPGAVEQLFMGLIISGLAMQAAGSSRPASGSEHQFSHLWEMRGLALDGHEVSHGFKVGVGSIAMTGLYQQLLAADLSKIDIDALVAAWPPREDAEAAVRATHPEGPLREKALEEIGAKYIPPADLAARLRQAKMIWPELRLRIADQLLSPDDLRSMLAAAGCPATPAEIGLTLPQIHDSYEAARQIRRRYTVLDFAYETGLLTTAVDHLFTPDGYWERIVDAHSTMPGA